MKANAFQTTLAIAIAAVFASTSSAQKVDWPMWGGTNDRNMVSEMEGGVSTDFNMDKGKNVVWSKLIGSQTYGCLLYTSPSPRDATLSRMPSSA